MSQLLVIRQLVRGLVQRFQTPQVNCIKVVIFCNFTFKNGQYFLSFFSFEEKQHSLGIQLPTTIQPLKFENKNRESRVRPNRAKPPSMKKETQKKGKNLKEVWGKVVKTLYLDQTNKNNILEKSICEALLPRCNEGQMP